MTNQAMVLLALVCLSAAGCAGASGPRAGREVAGESAAWSEAELRKLDPELRSRVESGSEERLAVKVFFHELPTDSELADLLLSRLGEQAIGQVEPDTLHRIAARGDVERIEGINDVGYALP